MTGGLRKVAIRASAETLARNSAIVMSFTVWNRPDWWSSRRSDLPQGFRTSD
jgi:hypothetical protein